MSNAINWFEIPSKNLDKAARFYETTLGVTLRREVFGGVPHAVFETDKSKPELVSGAVVDRAQNQPGAAGVVIYLNCPDGVPAALARATQAGGKQLMPTTSIGENGWIAIVEDLDGNVVGLHAM